ncbi:MAG: hypothetical protein Q9217_000152 [Psora testacea]
MVRERTPARTQPKPHLSGSWVVESDDGDDEYTPPPAITNSKKSRRPAEPAESPRKRQPRVHTTRASAEPELIMPSIYEGSVGGSWLGEERQGERHRQPRWRSQESEGRNDSAYMRQPTAQQGLETTFDKIVVYLGPILTWLYEVLGGTLQKLRTPISYLLAFWLLLGLFVFLRNLFFSSVYSALSPVCRIPGARSLNLPMCRSSIANNYEGVEPPPVQFDQLMMVQDKFQEVLRESAGGVSLPMDMKRGETSIRDLRQMVRFSQLHSRNELVLEFDGFIETARMASYDLQKFNSHVGRAIDNILATAKWTKRALDGIAERDASRGAIASFFNDRVLAPFQPLKFTEDALLDQYIQHTHIVENEINRLVAEAQALLLILQNLEDRLDVIHGIAVRDDLHVQGTKSEVLSQLWTMLGGNRSKLGKYDSQLRLLSQMNTYRQNAITHISDTLLKLQGMGAELEELRERVGSVDVLGGKGAVPLTLHIENIERGVERLERGRKSAKELEDEELSRSLSKWKEKGDERMIDGK